MPNMLKYARASRAAPEPPKKLIYADHRLSAARPLSIGT
jgi:hypothetical protein